MRTCLSSADNTAGSGSDPERKINTDQLNFLIHQQYKNLQRWREQIQKSAKTTRDI